MSLANDGRKKSVLFKLEDRSETDLLLVDMNDITPSCVLEVNLNDETLCQEGLKDVFLKIAEAMLNVDIEVIYQETEGYPRALIQDAMRAYVADLSNEIPQIKMMIDSELNQR